MYYELPKWKRKHGCEKDCIEMSRSGKSTLCWICKKAVPNRDTGFGCDWSKHFLPVEGWKAKRVMQAVYPGKKRVEQETFLVYECPEFEEG